MWRCRWSCASPRWRWAIWRRLASTKAPNRSHRSRTRKKPDRAREDLAFVTVRARTHRAFRQDGDDIVPDTGGRLVRHHARQARAGPRLAERICPVGAIQFTGNHFLVRQRNPPAATIPRDFCITAGTDSSIVNHDFFGNYYSQTMT